MLLFTDLQKRVKSGRAGIKDAAEIELMIDRLTSRRKIEDQDSRPANIEELKQLTAGDFLGARIPKTDGTGYGQD